MNELVLFDGTLAAVADTVGDILRFAPFTMPFGVIGGLLFYLLEDRYPWSPDTNWFDEARKVVTNWRKERMLGKAKQAGAESPKTFTDGDFLSGEADFDYSVATIADLSKLIEDDLRELKQSSRFGYLSYSFCDNTAPHDSLLQVLEKAADPSAPLKPAAAKAVRDALNTYHDWAAKNYDSWDDYQAAPSRSRDHLGHYVADAVVMAAFVPRGLRLEQNEKQALTALRKALNVELAGQVSNVAYADLLKGKVT